MDEGLNQEEIEAEGINEVEYTTGFNWGYTIAEHNPELAKSLMDGLEKDSDRSQGIYFGCNEFFRVREQNRADELEKLRERGNDRGRDIE